ncbi:MAG: hypothetical protein IJN54_14660 [Lachnospiraceae bacterium]|nr:hypothetical protein [Lachnospiraceae bacterium]
MINIENLPPAQGEKINTSSKGNQNKWFYQNRWYKQDGLGYEALSEVLVSRLLEKTNVGNYVPYRFEILENQGRQFCGCVSENFMKQEDERLISIERLVQAYYRESAAEMTAGIADIQERIKCIEDVVSKITGLKDFGIYLKKIITIDALFFNEDRHFHNIAVVQRKDGSFRECPIFDNGAALFSDIKHDYPLHLSVADCVRRIKAKPFAMDFDEQLDACDILYGDFRFRATFTMDDVERCVKEFEGIYNTEILERVRNTMRQQMRKYSYLF